MYVIICMLGVIPNLQSKSLYVDCPEHYQEMQIVESNNCPVFDCSDRFSSYKLLIKHLESKHNNHTMCLLCLENSTLFVMEQCVITKTQLGITILYFFAAL